MNSLLLCSNTVKTFSSKTFSHPPSAFKWLVCVVLVVRFQSGYAQVQTDSLYGTVTTAGGIPAPYASILLSGTHKDAVSDGILLAKLCKPDAPQVQRCSSL